MTRSEAAKICQSIKFMMDKDDYSEEVEEALNMAIAALKQLSLPKIIIRQGEQEPNEDKRTIKRTGTHACDYISRQDAIDALAKEMPSLTTPDGSGEFDHDIQITDEAFVDCMQIINGLPSAQPERKTDGDTISRQSATDAIEPTLKSILQGNSFKAVNVMDKIRDLPTAQPFTEEQIQTMQELESAQVEKAYELGKADRPTGRWHIEPGIGCFCSKCSFDIGNDLDFMEYVHYCPNCGARMESDEQ